MLSFLDGVSLVPEIRRTSAQLEAKADVRDADDYRNSRSIELGRRTHGRHVRSSTGAKEEGRT